ncbi:hypothetical protein [Flavobacterium sp. RS13.1]|uniref:hypothetical protein n=1 Tax=Flavobacterium sp. RS13.1 TaxID=3400345 RepID=UPI003AACC7E3
MLSSGQVLKELNNQYTKSGLQLQTGFFMGIHSRKAGLGCSLNLFSRLTPESEKPKLKT